MAIVMKECPQCPVVQLYTWGIFMAIYLLSWDAAITYTISKLQGDLSAAAGSHRSLRRPYLIVLVAYSIVVAWLQVIYWVLLIFLACAMLCMTSPFGPTYWAKLVRLFARPKIVLHFIDLSHVGFHALVVGASMLASALSIGFYITDDDLIHKDTLNSKMLRVLLTAPAAMAAAYAFYVLFCVVCTM